MDTWIYSGLKLLHVGSMAIWLGGGMIAPLGMEKAFTLGHAHAVELVARLHAASRIIITAAVVTFVSGALLIGAVGGQVAPRILIGALLTVVIFALGGTLASPALREVGTVLKEGGELSAAAPYVRRFVIVTRIEQTLRFITLALMILPF